MSRYLLKLKNKLFETGKIYYLNKTSHFILCRNSKVCVNKSNKLLGLDPSNLLESCYSKTASMGYAFGYPHIDCAHIHQIRNNIGRSSGKKMQYCVIKSDECLLKETGSTSQKNQIRCRLERILQVSITVPYEIKCHTFLSQSDLINHCNSKNVIMAYNPLGSPDGSREKPTLLLYKLENLTHYPFTNSDNAVRQCDTKKQRQTPKICPPKDNGPEYPYWLSNVNTEFNSRVHKACTANEYPYWLNGNCPDIDCRAKYYYSRNEYPYWLGTGNARALGCSEGVPGPSWLDIFIAKLINRAKTEEFCATTNHCSNLIKEASTRNLKNRNPNHLNIGLINWFINYGDGKAVVPYIKNGVMKIHYIHTREAIKKLVYFGVSNFHRRQLDILHFYRKEEKLREVIRDCVAKKQKYREEKNFKETCGKIPENSAPEYPYWLCNKNPRFENRTLVLQLDY